MKALFIAYQDKTTRRWAPVGKLTRLPDSYRFVYTKGVKNFPNFVPFGRMTNLDAVYRSKELFPLFANRVLPKNRPEHAEYLQWLGLSAEEHDSIDELSRTGGLRATDNLELIPCPAPSSDGYFEEFFFCRGIAHAHPSTKAAVGHLRQGDRLFLMRDIQNDMDAAALALRTDDPFSMIGYTPAYFAKDFSNLLDEVNAQNVQVTVAQVNENAPSQYFLLCHLRAPWPKFFSPCSGEEFQEFVREDDPNKQVAAL